jgi:transposase, IS5 family
MQRQGSFSQAEYAGKKKQTRRDKFLAEMERVVPWARLVERLRPFYPKGERGRPPIGLERVLRLYFLQQRFGLADETLEDALYDSGGRAALPASICRWRRFRTRRRC